MKKVMQIILILCSSCLFAENNQLIDEMNRAIISDDQNRVFELMISNEDDMIYNISKADFYKLALQKNRTNIIKLFLEKGAEINYIEGLGRYTPLYYACKNNNQEIINLLLQMGADPLYNNLPEEDQTGLLIRESISKNNNKFIEICLRYGYDPNYMDFRITDDKPIILAIKYDNLEAFKLFIDYDAKIDVINLLNNYMTPLALAISKYGKESEYVKIIESEGALDIKYKYDRPFTGYCNTRNLRIRKDPNINSPIIGLLQENDEVKMLEVTPLAYKIDDMEFPWVNIIKGDLSGWVFGGYIIKKQMDNAGIYH